MHLFGKKKKFSSSHSDKKRSKVSEQTQKPATGKQEVNMCSNDENNLRNHPADETAFAETPHEPIPENPSGTGKLSCDPCGD